MKDEARNDESREVIAIPAVAGEPASEKLPASRSNDLAQVTSVPLMQVSLHKSTWRDAARCVSNLLSAYLRESEVGGGGWGEGESRSTLSRAEDCSRRSTSPASPANDRSRSIPLPSLPLFPSPRNDSSTRESCRAPTSNVFVFYFILFFFSRVLFTSTLSFACLYSRLTSTLI